MGSGRLKQVSLSTVASLKDYVVSIFFSFILDILSQIMLFTYKIYT